MSNQRTNTQIGFTIMMFAVVAGVIFLIHTAMQGVVGAHAGSADMSPEAVAKRIAPVAQLNTGAPIVAAAETAVATAAPAAARSGEAVYKATCSACHASGAAGAPKFGDKAAWSPRIKQGMNVLVDHAIKGFTGKTGMMPARGTCGNCSDAELKSAVEYMANNSK